MHSHADIIKALEEPMDYKYRVQRINDFGASLVAYIDARQAAKRLTDVFGLNWTREYENRDNSLYCRVTVKTPEGDWVSREDVGTESQAEAEKGEASDAFKRAAVSFGVGAFLYNLGEMQLPVAKKNGKNYPAVLKGVESSILYNSTDLTNFATLVNRHGLKIAQKMWEDGKKVPEPIKNFNERTDSSKQVSTVSAKSVPQNKDPVKPTKDKTIQIVETLSTRFGYDSEKLLDAANKYTSEFRNEQKITAFEKMVSNVLECNILADKWVEGVPSENSDATKAICGVIHKHTGNENGFMLEFTMKNKELTLSPENLNEIKETIEFYANKK